MTPHDIDLEAYPLHDLAAPAGRALVERCRAELARDGMFNLTGFLAPAAIARAVAEVKPILNAHSFTHRRRHNIYFRKEIPGLAPDHPALAQVETVNHTICTDHLAGSIVRSIYEWPPLPLFLAAVMGKPQLHVMNDPLAGANVMQYRDGEALNWHFDRSEFTTTLLLQAPETGGTFEYRTGLRSPADPNYDGVARLLTGKDPEMRSMDVPPGTLNVFKGQNTAHRVTTVRGGRDRIIAVLSYYERPDATFTPEERMGFYGRTG